VFLALWFDRLTTNGEYQTWYEQEMPDLARTGKVHPVTNGLIR